MVALDLPFDDPGALLSPDQFFEIVDDVLIAAGREPLTPKGPQRRIIEVRDDDRVLQILAGPGSGKTEMLVLRVLYDLFVRGADASRLIVTTFTKRAANELIIRSVERAEAIQAAATKRGLKVRDPQVHNLRIGTLHSLCEQILVDHDTEYCDSGRAVIDQAEAYARMSRSLYTLGRHGGVGTVDRLMQRDELTALFTPPWEENSRALSGMRLVDVLMAVISQHVETWVPRCEANNTPNGIEVVRKATGLTTDLKTVTARWEAELEKNSVVDFATIQRLFQQRQQNFLEAYDHIFVDEFQDSNPIQFAIHTAWLASNHTRLTVVADDDQSLYRFRGSDIECLIGLEPFCASASIPFRTEALEVNYRSTKRIVRFTQAFRAGSVLNQLGLQKTIVPSKKADLGEPVRLFQGEWDDVCAAIASDLAKRNVGKAGAGETAAVLMFSTKEREFRDGSESAALALRNALENAGLRVFNLSSKTAGDKGSPVTMLLGLLSYLVDPITKAVPAGRAREVEVWASHRDYNFADEAPTCPPSFRGNTHHIDCQKWFIKADGGSIGFPAPSRKPLLDLIDSVRGDLVAAKGKARLTLAGLIARLLADPFFRGSGFTPRLFRQALFTQLFEANVAPTRLTMASLDNPLAPTVVGGKVKWDDSLWTLLINFGGYLQNVSVEDLEVEAFEQDAVLIMTHHRAKGLEFDHVVAAGLGREPDHGPALRTKLFSGLAVPYKVTDTSVATNDVDTKNLALADREREAYVALSRAKKTLTILHDSVDPPPMMLPNPVVTQLFANSQSSPHKTVSSVEQRNWS